MPQRRPRPSFFLNMTEEHRVSISKAKYAIPNFWNFECLRTCIPALAMRVRGTCTSSSAGIEHVVTAQNLRMLQMFSSSLLMPFPHEVAGLYASLLLMKSLFIDLFFSGWFTTIRVRLLINCSRTCSFLDFCLWYTEEIFHQLLVPT